MKKHHAKDHRRKARFPIGQRVLRDRWGEPLDRDPPPLRGRSQLAVLRAWMVQLMSGTSFSAGQRPALVEQIVRLYAERGARHYGEGVSQREHALQAALLARSAYAGSALVTAALLHDIGHLLDKRGEDAAQRGIDSCHEAIGAGWLARHFGPAVVEPVRLHVAAKRYLCAVEAGYAARLSPASQLSIVLQGGTMTAAEVAAFEAAPFAAEAVALRRWDEAAKETDLTTPAFEDFIPDILAAA